jgi:hypothetical protein
LLRYSFCYVNIVFSVVIVKFSLNNPMHGSLSPSIGAELSQITVCTLKYPEFLSLCGVLAVGYQAQGGDQKPNPMAIRSDIRVVDREPPPDRSFSSQERMGSSSPSMGGFLGAR